MTPSRILAAIAWCAVTAAGVWCIWAGYPTWATAVLVGMSWAVLFDGLRR